MGCEARTKKKNAQFKLNWALFSQQQRPYVIQELVFARTCKFTFCSALGITMLGGVEPAGHSAKGLVPRSRVKEMVEDYGTFQDIVVSRAPK